MHFENRQAYINNKMGIVKPSQNVTPSTRLHSTKPSDSILKTMTLLFFNDKTVLPKEFFLKLVNNSSSHLESPNVNHMHEYKQLA